MQSAVTAIDGDMQRAASAELGWRVAGTSVTGTRHAAAGEACQDRHRLHITPEGVLIAVVSDGAGSARFGGDGAAILCDAVVAGLDHYLAEVGAEAGTNASPARMLAGLRRAVRDAVMAARDAATAVAGERGSTLGAFHATLVGVVCMPGKGGLFFHIGDGAAVALGDDGARWTLSAPSNGEFADTTYFFTEDRWRETLRFATFDDGFDTILVMSDGVTDIGLTAQPGGAVPFLPFFTPVCRFLAANDRATGEAALHATLDGAQVCERTTDDKTLIWATVAAP